MSAQIHPTAVIEPGAEIGPECEIGPYCVIGPQARLGAACRLHAHVVIDGLTSLGPGCELFSFACIGKRTQDLKWKGGTAAVEIGARTTLREYVTVHASTLDGGRTVVGSDCNILAYCHVAHDCVLGDRVIMSNLCHLAGHVTVEERAVLGGMVAVVQFVRVGRLAMVGATSKVVQDIAPFALVDGSPAAPVSINKIGMERNGFSAERIQEMARAHKIFFRAGLRAEEALARLRAEFPNNPDVALFIAFAQASERGLARPVSSRAAD
jgi:UDP-N-acetylglucosamine acyltransferase